MFSLDNQQLNRLRLVQALAEALGADDSPIAEMLTEAGYTTTERACQLAAQSMVLTFEAHSLGKLSAPSAPPAVRVKHPKPSLASGGGTVPCPHCGKECSPRGLTKHANACKDKPANQ